MMQLLLRIKPSWGISRITESHPSVSIHDWCNFAVDFYHLHSPKTGELERAARSLLTLNSSQGFHLQRRTRTSKDTLVLVMKCAHRRDDSVEETMNRFGCVAFYPFVFEQGWMKMRAVALEEERVARMLARLARVGEVQVDSKVKVGPELLRENFAIPTTALADALTPKQAESLLFAIESGYYRVPRKTKFEDIAGAMKVPRTTYEEHVRKAESKVITAVAPYLSLYFGRPLP